MGRGSGGTKGGASGSKRPWVTLVPNNKISIGIDKRAWKYSKELSTIADKKVYNEVMDGIAKFNSIFGMDDHQKNILLGTLKSGAAGVTYYTKGTGKIAGILLDKGTFMRSYDDLVKTVEKQVNSGYWVKTKYPAQVTVVHELAHTLWNSGWWSSMDQGKMAMTFSRFRNKYNTREELKKAGWGAYARTSPNEFFAEGLAKHILGKPDEFTKVIMEVAKNSDRNLKKKI